jgi:hypothetical protein
MAPEDAADFGANGLTHGDKPRLHIGGCVFEDGETLVDDAEAEEEEERSSHESDELQEIPVHSFRLRVNMTTKRKRATVAPAYTRSWKTMT